MRLFTQNMSADKHHESKFIVEKLYVLAAKPA